MLPLSLRAMEAPYDSTSFIATASYAAFINLYHLVSSLSDRYAFGKPREVDLSDEVVVITGGKGGLGGCIAAVYGMKGVRVAVLDRSVGEEEEKSGAEEENDVRYYRCDIGDREDVDRVWKRVVDNLGTPTVLVNNAAVVNGKPFLELSVDDVERYADRSPGFWPQRAVSDFLLRTFRTNTLSHYHLTSLFLPPLLNRPNGGTLVTIASVLGYLGPSQLSLYSGTKAALIAYHTSLSAELASSSMPKNSIKTILVLPGALTTPLFAGLRQNRFRNFFGPVVDVRELAMKIVWMIDQGEGGVIAMPAYARWIAWMGVLPAGLQKLARWVGGLDGAMQAMSQRRTKMEAGEIVP